MGHRRQAPLILAALLAVIGCEPEEEKDDPEVESCAAACVNLRDLGCEQGEPTPDGSTCEEVCTTVQSEPGPDLPLECIIASDSCDEADSC